MKYLSEREANDYSFQKTVKTKQDKPSRKDDSKSKDRKKDYSKQRSFKRGE